LDAIRSSYQFHSELESPFSFLRREWQALTIFGGVYVIVLLIGVLAVDPAFFYPRLQTDPLLYYLKGLAFVETGSTVARTVINRRPFQYAAMPGVLRAPFMMMFSDFDNQLRAIQLSNIVLITITALMFAYVLSWALPRSKHWMAIGFTFGFFLLNPEWVANVFSPLADAPYAAFTFGTIIVATRVLTSARPFSRLPAIAGGSLLFALSFMVKFTAPVLAVFAAALGAGRPRERAMPRRTKILVSLAILAGIAILVFLNWNPIVWRYLPEPVGYLLFASKSGMFLNLTGFSIPAQIIPVYHLAFAHDPIVRPYSPVFGTTPGDIVLTAVGVGLSLVMFYGMWRARARFMPEILYFLAALPVITLMMPSTRRYLMAYAPLIWIFFYVGAASMLGPIFKRVKFPRLSPLARFGLAFASVLVLIFVRSQRVVGSTGERSAGISIGATRGYINEVTSTFRSLRGFLETLPRDRALLMGAPGTRGRWTVISDLKYYYPDSALSMAARKHDIYVVVECGALEVCQDFEKWDAQFRATVDRVGVGPFDYEPVFSRSTEHAKARVYRLTNPQ